MVKARQTESLFVVAEQTGQIAERSFEDFEHPRVSLNERAISLQNTITYLAELSQLTGFVESGSHTSYGEGSETVRERAIGKIGKLVAGAEEEFKQASGHYQMITSGMPERETKRATTSLYAGFLKEYSRSRNYKKAQDYRRRLADNVRIMSAVPATDLGTIAPDVKTLVESEPKAQDEVLTNFEKLEVLLTDPRAGFLPKTNREKTTALTWLSYIDSPDGVVDQLIEVFHGSQKVRGVGARGGLRAIESITYESADYAVDALQSHVQLRELQTILVGVINPGLSLNLVSEANGLEGYWPLLIYSKQKEFYDQQPELVPYYEDDPLRTVEERWIKAGPGRHKKVHDRITASRMGILDDPVDDELKKFLETSTVADARALIVEALSNEAGRTRFFTERLRDVHKLSNVNKIFRHVVNTAIELSGFDSE